MNMETRTNRQIFDIQGTVTGPGGLDVAVRFDLIELEDLIDGIPGSKYSYGILHFQDPLEPSVKLRLLSATRRFSPMAAFERSVPLQTDSFTLIDTIKDFTVQPELAAA